MLQRGLFDALWLLHPAVQGDATRLDPLTRFSDSVNTNCCTERLVRGKSEMLELHEWPRQNLCRL